MAVKVTHPVCAGLDVHKSIIVASIVDYRNNPSLPVHKHFSTNTSFYGDLVNLADWIKENDCQEVFMESTGKYSIPVYNILEKEGLSPHIVNPKYTVNVKGYKNDKSDAERIADLGSMDLLKTSYIPEENIRSLRDLSRRRMKLVQEAGDEKRRIQNALTVANIKIDAVFSDTTGASSLRVIQYLMATDEDQIDLNYVDSLVSKKCKKRTNLPKAIDGIRIPDSCRFILKQAIDHLKFLCNSVKEHEREMENTIKLYKGYFDLLITIPGISKLSAMQIIAEIGCDMNQFEDVDHFISWCGLCPASNQSANKHKSVKIGKGGKYLKPVLMQCALAAIKNKGGYFYKKYQSIAARRGGKRALIAIARKMMIAVFNMFLTGEEFSPRDEKKEPTPSKEEMDKYQQLYESITCSPTKIEKDCLMLAKEVIIRSGVDKERLEELMQSHGLIITASS